MLLEYLSLLCWLTGHALGLKWMAVVGNGLVVLVLLRLVLQVQLVSDICSEKKSENFQILFWNTYLRSFALQIVSWRLRVGWAEEHLEKKQEWRAEAETSDKAQRLVHALVYIERHSGAYEVGLLSEESAGRRWISSQDEKNGRLQRIFKARIEAGYCTGDLTALEKSLMRLYGFSDIRLEVPGEGKLLVLAFTHRQSGSFLLRNSFADLLEPLERELALCREIDLLQTTVESTSELHARRDEHFAHISHDIRGPLANIVNATRLLKKTAADSKESLTDIVLANCRRISGIVDSFLDYSRCEFSECTPVKSEISFTTIKKDILSVWKLEAESKGLQLNFRNFDASLEIFCDQRDLHRCLDNVVGNAIKYTDEGSISITAEAVGSSECSISVIDTGVGMPPEVVERAFLPFDQLGRTAVEGLGLGLFVTKSLVEKNGGQLHLSSFRNSGTTVRFVFPSSARSNIAPAAGSLLLIDDDEDFLRLFARSLEFEGCKVATARSIEEAEELLSETHFKAVLCDWCIGGTNAAGFISELSSKVACGVMSGHRSLKGGLEDSGLRWFLKPTEPKEVVRWLAEIQTREKDELKGAQRFRKAVCNNKLILIADS